MNCSEFKGLLDCFIDNEMDADLRARFVNHAAECSDCHAKLTTAEQLRDFLSHLDDDVAVPLPAQAAWRGAVRAEARRKQMNRIYRATGLVAAACVLTIGVTAGLRSRDVTPMPVQNRDTASAQMAYVESDGVESGANAPETVMMTRMVTDLTSASFWERTIYADDLQTARGYLLDIVEEYGGSVVEEQNGDEALQVYVDVPTDDLTAFISAVDHIGTSVEGEEIESAPMATTVSICIVICEK